MILPGASLGILGGGQLGRMFVAEARTMGYRTVVLDPDEHSPAGAIADEHLRCDYTDEKALDRLADTCAAVTLEFENIPLEALKYLQARNVRVSPDADAAAFAQDRIREKAFINQKGIATVNYHAVQTRQDIADGFARLKSPCLLKTARLGYDGKGQRQVTTADEAQEFFAVAGEVDCVLEEQVNLKREVSVVAVRGEDGVCACYPIAENVHRNGILHTSAVGASQDDEFTGRVQKAATTIADELNYCGVLAVEFFVTDADALYVNEIAPRPHNSGHYTLDACATSQFAQQARMMCGLPIGSTQLLSTAVMVNILGDAWHDDTPPDWGSILRHPHACLHLYGKSAARPGRKMGHFCLLGDDVEQLGNQAEMIYQRMMKNERNI